MFPKTFLMALYPKTKLFEDLYPYFLKFRLLLGDVGISHWRLSEAADIKQMLAMSTTEPAFIGYV